MSEKEFVIGMRNKRGIFRKVKWMPNRIMITKEEYDEYQSLKKLKTGMFMAKIPRKDSPEASMMGRFPRETRCHICKKLYTANKPADLLVCGNCVANEMKGNE